MRTWWVWALGATVALGSVAGIATLRGRARHQVPSAYVYTARVLDMDALDSASSVSSRYVVQQRGSSFALEPAEGAFVCDLGAPLSPFACRTSGSDSFELVSSLPMVRPSLAPLDGLWFAARGLHPAGRTATEQLDVAVRPQRGLSIDAAVYLGGIAREDGSFAVLGPGARPGDVVILERKPDAPMTDVPLVLPSGGALHDVQILWDQVVVSLAGDDAQDHVYATSIDDALAHAPSYREVFTIAPDDATGQRSHLRGCLTDTALVVMAGSKLAFLSASGALSAPFDVRAGALYCHGESASVVSRVPEGIAHRTCTRSQCREVVAPLPPDSHALQYADVGGRLLAVWRGRSGIRFRVAAPADFATARDRVALDDESENHRPLHAPGVVAFELASGPKFAALLVQQSNGRVHVLRIGPEATVRAWDQGTH